MPGGLRLPLRRAATALVFIVGVVATAATSPASTFIDIAPADATFHLDPGHPAALSRFVVRLDPEATSSYSYLSVYLMVDAVRAAGSGVDTSGVAASGVVGAVRFIVASAAPGTVPSSLASASPGLEPVPTRWQAEVSPPSQVSLPVDCGGSVGPCERGFWLIAELADPEAGAIDAHWSVRGSLSYTGNAWPSGAMANVEIGAPTLLAGPVAQLVASTETEMVTLGPDQPALAREVEITVGAAAIPQDGSPVGALSVDLVRRPGSGGSPDRSPVVQVYPVDGPGAVAPLPGAPAPSPAPPDLDPFAGCQPGAACTRRFLVTIAWTGDSAEAEAFDWRLNVRRVDLVRVWTTPAELSASVTRRFDVASGSKPSTVHLEGDASAAAFDAPPQVHLALATRTTATDPDAGLLPVPGVMTYRAHVVEPQPATSGNGTRADTVVTSRIANFGTRPIYRSSTGADVSVVANPMAAPTGGCRVGEACPDLTIATIVSPGEPGAPLPTVRYHWSLDLAVYSFTDVPISLSARDLSPTAGR